MIEKEKEDNRRKHLRNVIAYIVCWSHYHQDVLPEDIADIILDHVDGVFDEIYNCNYIKKRIELVS